MKHQYVGDVNDYIKYGILRCLAKAGYRIGVCWMLTPDDHPRDGKKLGYLDQEAKWGLHDPELFKLLKIVLACQRHLRVVEDGGLLGQALFYSDLVPNSTTQRIVWLSGCLEMLSGSDLLFFDPDNGIEVPSKRKGCKGSEKYIYWDELASAWETGKSVLVFQHFPRENHGQFALRVAKEMESRLVASKVILLASDNVLYLWAIHKNDSRENEALNSIKGQWARRITVN